jgi:predicted DNA-binding WGR domain protein
MVAATVAAKKTNAAATTLLLRWAQASEESNHTSQAPKTFRRAAKSLREHPDPVTTRAEALAVKFIGDKLADSLQGWFDFQQRAPARRVAMLRHEEEGKWWSVTVAGEMAQRSWGKRSATGLEGPGMDNWEKLPDERAALHWACQKVAKQLSKGYSHAPGSQAQFDSACTDSGGPPAATGRARGRAVGGDAAAAAPPAAARIVPPAAVPPAATTADTAAAAPQAAATRPAQRAHQPKLLDARGEVRTRGGSLCPPQSPSPSPSPSSSAPQPQPPHPRRARSARRRRCWWRCTARTPRAAQRSPKWSCSATRSCSALHTR